jgi:hypothetical protein
MLASRLERLHLGDGDPLADIDVLRAGSAAAGAAVAGAEPFLQAVRRCATQGQGLELADTLHGLGGIEARLARRRADLEALAAARAAVGRFGGQCLQPFRIGAQGNPPRIHREWNVRGKSLSSLRPGPKHSPTGNG